MDASNAFNNLNRIAALHNMQHTCPVLSKVLINTYRLDSKLFVGGKMIPLQNQGDPLIDQVANNARQICFADDASAGGRLEDLRNWWGH